jgi:selT/selW/selH-like putative selenoprotein
MAELKRSREVEVVLVRSSGGVFEVTLDGAPIFSKKAMGRFPEAAEVLAHIPA